MERPPAARRVAGPRGLGDGRTARQEERCTRSLRLPPSKAIIRFLLRPQVVLLDRKDLPSAGGSEAPLECIAPAIGNAIFSASGIRLRSLPLVPNGLRT